MISLYLEVNALHLSNQKSFYKQYDMQDQVERLHTNGHIEKESAHQSWEPVKLSHDTEVIGDTNPFDPHVPSMITPIF